MDGPEQVDAEGSKQCPEWGGHCVPEVRVSVHRSTALSQDCGTDQLALVQAVLSGYSVTEVTE